MDGLIAAYDIKDILRPAGEIDYRQMPLVVAGVARITAVSDIQIAIAGRAYNGER